MAEKDNLRVLPLTREAERPLSPHLSIYKPQLTSGMSIFHKFTGIGLAGGLVLLVAWLVSIAMGAEAYGVFASWLKHPIGLLFLLAWSWAFFYHMMNGVRHLLWSVAWCMSLRAIYLSGGIVLVLSFGATAALWIMMYVQGIIGLGM